MRNAATSIRKRRALTAEVTCNWSFNLLQFAPGHHLLLGHERIRLVHVYGGRVCGRRDGWVVWFKGGRDGWMGGRMGGERNGRRVRVRGECWFSSLVK
jgi:hypothetical protein